MDQAVGGHVRPPGLLPAVCEEQWREVKWGRWEEQRGEEYEHATLTHLQLAHHVWHTRNDVLAQSVDIDASLL